MTIEVTDHMIYAFAGEPEITATDAHAIEVGLRAVLAIVERDQVPTPDAYQRADAAWNRKMAQVNAVISVLNRWQRWREQADEGAPFSDFYDQVLAALDSGAA